MSTEITVALISSLFSAVISSVVTYLLTKKKTIAEIEKLQAEAQKARAEAEKISFELENAKVSPEKNESDVDPEELAGMDAYSRGTYYYETKNYERAIAAFTQAIFLEPNRADYLIKRGQVYFEKGNILECLRDETAAIQLEPSNADYWWRRGNTHMNLRNYQQATVDYTKALELSPTTARYFTSRGNAYRNMGEYQKAISDYTQAMDLERTEANNYFGRGLCYRAERKYDEAITDFNQAIYFDSNNHEYYFQRGVTYVFKGEGLEGWGSSMIKVGEGKECYDLAIFDFTNAIRLSNYQNGYYFSWRSRSHYRIGDNDHLLKAIDDATHAIQLLPEYGWAYFWSGVAQQVFASSERFGFRKKELMNMKKKGIEDAKRAIELGVSVEEGNKLIGPRKGEMTFYVSAGKAEAVLRY